MGRLVLLLFLVPLFEVWLLLRVGGLIGGWPTIAAVIFTAMVGGYLVRQQGLETVQRMQKMSQSGQLPALEMLEGVAILMAGALLITPGFFTDAVGFLLLWPQGRRSALRRLIATGVIQSQYQATAGHPFGAAGQSGGAFGNAGPQNPTQDTDVIDGEYRRED